MGKNLVLGEIQRLEFKFWSLSTPKTRTEKRVYTQTKNLIHQREKIALLNGWLKMQVNPKNKEGKTLKREVSKQFDGWGATVWFGGRTKPVTAIRRYIYKSRYYASRGCISDDVGKNGRIK